jgi:hypothetical protein
VRRWPEEDAAPVDRSDATDPGMARERTQLAWNRSGLAVVAVVAIMVRRLWPLGDAEAFALLVVVAAGSLVWAVGMFLARRSGVVWSTPGVMGTTACRMLTIGTLVLAGAGIVLALFTPS